MEIKTVTKEPSGSKVHWIGRFPALTEKSKRQQGTAGSAATHDGWVGNEPQGNSGLGLEINAVGWNYTTRSS